MDKEVDGMFHEEVPEFQAFSTIKKGNISINVQTDLFCRS